MLGVFARLVKSDLKLPDQLYETLSIYLLLAIGLKGGLELSKQPLLELLPEVLALMAFGLVLTTNPVAVAWSFVALAVTLLYPYAKRVVSMPQAVLGVAFSFGIPMAFAAVNGAGFAWQELTVSAMSDCVPSLAWALLGFNLFWVLAYDTEYAMVDRDDDLHIGMKTSAITLGRYDVLAVMGFYAVFLCGWWALLQDEALGLPWVIALVVSILQVAWHFQLIRSRSREGCFKAFRLNHWLGASVFAGIVAGFSFLPA